MSGLGALLLTAGLLGAQDLATTSGIRLRQAGRVRGAQLVDVDLDGRDDVVIVRASDAPSGTGGTSVRGAQAHVRRSGGFVSEPDWELDLTDDVVAYAVADVHPDPGAELVLFSAQGVFAWRPRASDERERFQLLLRADFLWQLPSGSRVYSWALGVVDLDRDGLHDLVVPEPRGYRVALQRRGADGAASFEVRGLLLPPDHDGGSAGYTVSDDVEGGAGPTRTDDEVSFSMQVGSRDLTESVLFRVTSTIPSPHFADWDADGDLDLVAQGARRLYVWLLGPGGYRVEPDLALRAPVEAGERRNLDVSYSAHAVDLDGDRRSDFVVLSGDKRANDVRSQLQVFTQRAGEPLFGEDGLPRQVLVLAGFAGAPSLDDVDGDGRVDLVVGALRPDLIDTLRSATSKRIDVELYVYLNQGGTFSRRPDLAHGISIPVEAGRVVTRFFGDVTGDGVSDLLTRHDDGRLRVLYVRRGREGWTVLERPLWELAIDPRASLVVEPGGRDRRPQLLVVEEEQVLHVGFGR